MKPTLLALACAALAACTPDAIGPNSRPAPQRWVPAVADASHRTELDRSTMEVHGGVVRVWTRSMHVQANGTASPPSMLAHEEFDCVRGLRRVMLQAIRVNGVLGKPAPVGAGGDVWKQGTYDPNDRTNFWGQTLVQVCSAAGVPFAAADSLPPHGAGPHISRYTLRTVDGVALPASIRSPDVLPATITAGHVDLLPGGRFALSRTARYAPPLDVDVFTKTGTYYLGGDKLELVEPGGFQLLATLRGSTLSFRQGGHVYVYSR